MDVTLQSIVLYSFGQSYIVNISFQLMVSNVYAVYITFQSMVMCQDVHSHHLAYVCSNEGSTQFPPSHSVLVV